MKTRSQTASLGMQFREANIIPTTVNEKDLTIDFVFTTGAEGKRFDWNNWEYFIEELEVSEEAMDLSRLNNQAPFLRQHHNDTEEVLGVIVKAWVENGEGLCRVRFDDDDEQSMKYFNKYRKGFLSKVSVGYNVKQYLEKTTEEDKFKRMIAKNWIPMEVSAVAIPFDDGAKARSEQENINKMECELITRVMEDNTMSKKANQEPTNPTQEPQATRTEPLAPVQTPDLNQVRSEAHKQGSQVALDIMSQVRKFNLDDEFAAELVREGVSLEAANTRILNKLAEGSQERHVTSSNPSATVVVDEVDKKRDVITNAIMHRAGVSGVKLDPDARNFRNMSLLQIASHCAGIRSFEQMVSADEVIQRAFHSSSDFANILLSVANKTLASEYKALENTFDPFVTRVPLSDFKKKHSVRLSSVPGFQKVGEFDETQHGKLVDSGEAFALDSYKTGLTVGRVPIINDDVDALVKIPRSFAIKGKQLEGDIIYKLIASNPKMADGVALFHASRGNIATGNKAAPSVNGFSDARKYFRNLKDDNKQRIDVRLATVLAATGYETLLEQLLTKDIMVNTKDEVNPFRGKLTSVTDPRLDDADEKAWYGIGAKGFVDLIELGTLNGQGPQFHTENVFGTGVKFEALYDVGAGIMDWRGFWKNPGQ